VLLLPLGDAEQALTAVTKDAAGAVTSREIFGVRYVPLTCV
jgi:protein-L-isoaspartate O-methyltransferase